VVLHTTGASKAPDAELVAGRYRIEQPLGSGGMATVYQVLDLSTDRRVALKRLHPQADPRKRRRTRELFEREFYTLSHLAHPRVVEAFDYGLDESGPYYTMELLDGGELQQLAPLPWRRACELARDICSALSLVHSRRLVYRDLNPRNVRCTSDGRGKLIDFGAMGNMGPIKQVVGTPAYCAPEALDFQPLDARTDLYSLGATLYFMLTGRHAYPAKSFELLRSFWEGRPRRPAELVPDVPAALDALVMDLIHLDPGIRPANAAEVMEQLAVIEGRTFDELPQVTQAYLSAPNLVGRDAMLTRMRTKIVRGLRGRGGCMLIAGASGVGRSRLLNACLLEAKLLGALCLRADATDAVCDYGVLQALCAQLQESAAELAQQMAAPALALLGHALPALLEQQPSASLHVEPNPNRLRALVMTALKNWLLAIAAQRPLFLAIDDLHAIDEPSAAALALLAHDVGKQPLIIAASAETGTTATAAAALKLFSDSATVLRLGTLSARHTEELLRSMFGDVPHVQGNPRDVMQLAQYLVDNQLANYRAGSWSLPASIDAANLPSSMAQALSVRVQTLCPQARELGLYMTLSADRSITFDEFVALCPETNSTTVMDALEELQRAQVACQLADGYSIPQRGFSAALQADMDAQTQRRLHRGLAELFRQRGDEEFRRAQHLFHACEHEQGLDVLLAQAERSQALTDENAHEYFKLTRALPEDWFECYQQGLQLCVALKRPKQHGFALQTRLAGLIDVMNVPGTIGYPPLRELLLVLFEESGLKDFEALDSSLDAMERLKRAIETAQARYNQRGESERVFEPLGAIRQLVRASIATAGLAAKNLDYELWASTPSLKPLTALSPAIAAAHRLGEGVAARTTARMEDARIAYKWLVDLTAQAGSTGLGETNHRYLRFGVMFGLGTIEAGMGLASSLDWAREIESEPMHQVNAQLVRLLYHLWQGQVREADRLKEEIELLRIRNSPRQWLEGAHLLGQAAANAACDDLTRIKQTVNDLESLAQRQVPWVPVRDYALGEYNRIRGDMPAAVALFVRALTATAAGRHQIWPNAAGAHVRALHELGAHETARERGTEYLAQAEQAGLGYMINFIKMPLALVLATLQDIETGTRYADETIASFTALGTSGLNLVLAYETRARIAILAKNEADYERYSALCAQYSRGAKSRVLIAKHERLKQAARVAEVRATEITITTEIGGTRLGLTSVMLGSQKPSERAHKALDLLLRSSGTERGFLYWMSEQGPELSAQIGDKEAPEGLTAYVSQYLRTELHEVELKTRSLEEDLDAKNTALWTSELGERYRPLLLSHQMAGGFAVTGVAIVVETSATHFVHPGAVVAHLSRLAADSGDASPTFVE
jgi:hypothetical protein